MTQDTAVIFGNLVKEIERANAETERIAEMVRKNAATVSQTMTEMDEIKKVMNANVEISESSRQISANMADITERLLSIVGE